MITAMPPPPPKNPTAAAAAAAADPSTSDSTNNTAVEPQIPEPEQQQQQQPESITPATENPAQPANSPENSAADEQEGRNNNAAAVPYTIPPWSGTPEHHLFLEVIKDGAIVDQFDVNSKGAYMFGRVDLCDFVLEHPTISRFHAVIQFKGNGGAYLYDLGSTHGTFINKSQVKKRVYVDLHVGDVIRFGQSSRLYIFQGPSDLMPPEADVKRLRKAKIRQDMQDMEASLLRAKIEASRADGISWGIGEDAIDEAEDDVDEITWETYKGQLTEKQEKTLEKVTKRREKIDHMKKEIDAIRVKDIPQGGLTQGQQTQIARNEQRIGQIMEELESLEETLNESIQESLGARAGKLSRGKKKGTMEDDEDYLSDEDDFYDRTQKSSKHKSGENQSVETADSLLDKKDALTEKIKDKEKLLLEEDKPAETKGIAEAGDELDTYMSAVSSQLVLDKKEKLQKELSALQSELDRILYLLRIADPTGEAAKKRESRGLQQPKIAVKKPPSSNKGNRASQEKNPKIVSPSEKSQNSEPEGSLIKSVQEKAVIEANPESDATREKPESINTESTATVYTAPKPQWLGAVEERKTLETKQDIVQADVQETDQFVDYKDRKTILNNTEQLIEDAAPGLIIRKRKQVEKSEVDQVKDSEPTDNSELKVEDAVALLLKHSRGHHATDEEDRPVGEEVLFENQETKKDGKKPKRVLGPERPPFLKEPDYSSWVPPEGQSGDGRTSLNDRFGY